jgi:competence protein ComEA
VYLDRLRELGRRAGLRRVDPRVLGGLAAVGLVLVVAGGLRWARPGGGSFQVECGDDVARSAEASEASIAASRTVIVHVAGAVKRPGVVELADGSRVLDAVDACGGLLGNAEPSAVNLARVVADGEQVIIPTQDEAAAAATAGADGTTPEGKVDLNRASEGELEELPGVGPATAAKIVADREANGPFESAEDLMRVPGIGPKKLEALRDLVVVK